MRGAAAAYRGETAGAQPDIALARKRASRSTRLLAWYDRDRRLLPWRAAPGEPADPYRVWLSEIMLQQTTVKTVVPYFHAFTSRWSDVRALAAAPLEEVLSLWAGLGYYARARNLHACARAVVEHHAGRFPESEPELAQLPGIGPYTAAAIAAIAFDVRTVPVDGNVERVVARLFAFAEELPGGRTRLRALAQTLARGNRSGDLAQALMDLGATICTAKRPRCSLCPWRVDCRAYERANPENFPRKALRKKAPLRFGAAFVATRTDGALLVRTRPSKGLLGGMSEVPSSAWSEHFNMTAALASAPLLRAHRVRWRRCRGAVTHVFTHFALELAVYTARVAAHIPAPAGLRWVQAADLAREAFPTVMRKILRHAAGP
jgi:A/G-specific adenine glycosylase